MNTYPPVFIIGMNGSGTTMLADSLGRHPDLYFLPIESKILPYYAIRRERFKDLDTLEGRSKLAQRLGKCKAYWQVNGKSAVHLSDEELSSPGFAGVIDALYRHFAARQGKIRWGDKSPINTLHVKMLAELLPNSQFVHIIRDGRDAAQSFHRRWKYEPLHTITRWKQAVTAGRQQGETLGSERYHEVKYEELTTDPINVIRRLSTFLNLCFDDSTLSSSMRYMDPNNQLGLTGKIVPNSGKWQSYFTTKQIMAMEVIAGETLAKFDYPVTYRGDHDPSSVKLSCWRFKDGLSYTALFFMKYGVRALPMYARHVSNAVRQWITNN